MEPGPPTLEPVTGEYVDDEGDLQPETHWIIRGAWRVVAERDGEAIVIAPDHLALTDR